MDGYKKLLKSRKIRIAILNVMDFVPDSVMLKAQYRIKTGKKLNLKNPKRYSEKLQWYKAYYRDERMKKCVDKYEVREYVKDCGCGDILNDCYGVYNTPDEIDFDSLPNSFVLKDTLGGGGNYIIIVKDKSKLDIESAKKQMWGWVNTSTELKHPGREWMYDRQKHRIIAEKYLECPNGDLPDYKIFCFNGKAFCTYFMRNYRNDHSKGELCIVDRDFSKIIGCRSDFKPIDKLPERPENFDKMLELSEKLSKSFPHVRVDFFNIDGKIIFGEMTFVTASGYIGFTPDRLDYELGELFVLPEKQA